MARLCKLTMRVHVFIVTSEDCALDPRCQVYGFLLVANFSRDRSCSDLRELG